MFLNDSEFSRSTCAKFRGDTPRKFAEVLREFSRSFSAKSRGEKKWSARTYAKSRGVFSAKVRVREFLFAEWMRKKSFFLGLICRCQCVLSVPASALQVWANCGDELYDRKRHRKWLHYWSTINVSLTLSMCAHWRRPLPAFDFLTHLLLIRIGLRQSCEGIQLSCYTKSSWLAKINQWTEIIWLHRWHNNRALGNEAFSTLTVSALVGLPSSYFMLSRFDRQVQKLDRHGGLRKQYELREVWCK